MKDKRTITIEEVNGEFVLNSYGIGLKKELIICAITDLLPRLQKISINNLMNKDLIKEDQKNRLVDKILIEICNPVIGMFDEKKDITTIDTIK